MYPEVGKQAGGDSEAPRQERCPGAARSRAGKARGAPSGSSEGRGGCEGTGSPLQLVSGLLHDEGMQALHLSKCLVNVSIDDDAVMMMMKRMMMMMKIGRAHV